MSVPIPLIRSMFGFRVDLPQDAGLLTTASYVFCRECCESQLARNPVQVKQWAERHVRNCPALETMNDLAEIGMSDEHANWYQEKEILSDD